MVPQLLEFEFLQAIELQVFLFSQDRKRGYSSARQAEMMLGNGSKTSPRAK